MNSIIASLKKLDPRRFTQMVHPHSSASVTETTNMDKKGVKKRTRRVKSKKSKRSKRSTLKRKNVKSRKVMRGGMKEEDEGIEMMEITEKTIVLAELPVQYDSNYNVIESARKSFFVTYTLLEIIPWTNDRDISSKRPPCARFKISEISETAYGDNLLTAPIKCVVQLPTPPSESYTLSSYHKNPSYVELVLGLKRRKYMILEIK